MLIKVYLHQKQIFVMGVNLKFTCAKTSDNTNYFNKVEVLDFKSEEKVCLFESFPVFIAYFFI